MRQTDFAKGGHRYFFLMCMSIYASKCDVPKAKLRKDMQTVFEELKTIEHENPLVKEDMESALEAYSKEYCNFTIDNISKLTDVRIEKNKRNGRKQAQHLQLARGIRQIKGSMGEAVSGGGRPEMSKIVEEWRKEHPDGRKADCIRETGLSKPTVLKWWNAPAEPELTLEERLKMSRVGRLKS